MKTDKELLDLAAKAADMGCEWHDEAECMFWDGMPSMGYWNPLNDDGDAFRLAVKLDMQVTIDIGGGEVWVVHNYLLSMIVESLEGVADIYAATRRAIVRAAAAIGESK